MMKEPVIVLFALAALGSGAVACGLGPTATPTWSPLPTLIPTPLPVQAPGWEEVTVHTLCLEVEQSYPYPEMEGGSSVPIAETAKGILTRLGLRVVAEGAPCDATLTFVLTGEALGANNSGGRYCYSGAEVNGEMTLAFPECEPLTLPISSSYPPPIVLGWCPVKPFRAPFHRARSEALLSGLAHLWGLQALIPALGDEKQDVRDAAVEVLVDSGPDAVPVLIQALGDERWTVGHLAVEALKEITGQYFGRDSAAWQEWWEEQQ